MKHPRSPWPFALVIAFSVFVAMEFTLISMAAHGFEPPDDPQYYEHGLNYGEQIRQREQQHKLGWTLGTSVPTTLRAGQLFDMVARPRDNQGQALRGGRCEVIMTRPATARDDVRLPLVESEPGVYRAMVRPQAGPWDVRMQLRLGGHTFIEQARVEARR